jgi:hypothetical protein
VKARGKVCWTGVGLLVAGTGLVATGIVLLTSAAVTWTAERIRKSGPKHLDRTFEKLESVSSGIGSAAGRMQRHASRAAHLARKAGEGAMKGVGEALAQDRPGVRT